jgi:hypothetical protein
MGLASGVAAEAPQAARPDASSVAIVMFRKVMCAV